MSFTTAKAPRALDPSPQELDEATARAPLAHELAPSEPRAVLPEGAWTVDRASSAVAFSVSNFWISTVRGKIREFNGVLTVDSDGSLSIRASARVASLDTGIGLRDHHLGSADFLDAERYPCAELHSRRVRRLDGGRMAIDAELSLRGISRPLSLVASILALEAADGREVTRIRIMASGTLDRRPYGIARAWLLDKIVGAEIMLGFDIYASMTRAEVRSSK
jgi:polyisoprenoid-binding protein YceI